jgi:hypothetical protein
LDSHGLWPSDLSEAEQELLKGQLKAKIKKPQNKLQKSQEVFLESLQVSLKKSKISLLFSIGKSI